MAKWISQTRVSSVTKETRARTAYLVPRCLAEITETISTYFETCPDGEEVTLEVLESLGRIRLRELRGSHSFNRVKQDIGLLVAQTLVDLYGASRVETFRRQDGKAVSARRNTRPDTKQWAPNFAPHRILRDGPGVERILLDTCVVRDVVQGTPAPRKPLDIASLNRQKRLHPVSLADGTVVELAAAMARNSIPFEQWTAHAAIFDGLLDPDMPIAPGGRDLAAFWGAQDRASFDQNEFRAYSRAVWAYFRDATSIGDLSRPETFHAPSGQPYKICLNPDDPKTVLKEEGQRWSRWVSKAASEIKARRANGETITENDLAEAATIDLALTMGFADAKKLDLVTRVLARQTCAAANNPRSPKKKHNDALDLDLLFAIPLPAWICTSEKKKLLASNTSSPDRSAVMSPEELIERLVNES